MTASPSWGQTPVRHGTEQAAPAKVVGSRRLSKSYTPRAILLGVQKNRYPSAIPTTGTLMYRI
jgi:hypothetical protein